MHTPASLVRETTSPLSALDGSFPWDFFWCVHCRRTGCVRGRVRRLTARIDGTLSSVRGSWLALAALVIACGARTPLAADGEDASSDGAGGDLASQGVVADDAAQASEAGGDADPCAAMPPVPCPGGGHSYCVNGTYSECPKRCGICVPGSERVCFIAYCTRWGTQVCSSDGLSFGSCQEHGIPPKCAPIADQYGRSAELEQCCIDNGYCCEDR